MNESTSAYREVSVSYDDFIVTKSDQQGNLIYANRAFMQISGYPEYELLGKPHSMFRHPDTPNGIYRLLWNKLESGQECFLYLKNRTRNGDSYWVFTNISMDLNGGGKPSAYFAVHRRPHPEGVEAIKPIYQEMRRIEQSAGQRDAADQSLNW